MRLTCGGWDFFIEGVNLSLGDVEQPLDCILAFGAHIPCGWEVDFLWGTSCGWIEGRISSTWACSLQLGENGDERQRHSSCGLSWCLKEVVNTCWTNIGATWVDFNCWPMIYYLVGRILVVGLFISDLGANSFMVGSWFFSGWASWCLEIVVCVWEALATVWIRLLSMIN
jgi:hypothetical protein